ncbi:helix-turn-helix domain-containing protein [Limosilactobacillus caviae]|uniref:helix-turn-helix domain-containing protein n=1 Tax=Limosilactobacillus caviae TaxID=1769424 RepID=UPI001CDBECD4|nr:helix-turn-helix transcriptional regulator [Limosilactobacillus caviae]MCD7124745.1 helix-turn-helix domain-containing protein [Limosilactobacillus caviae]
MSFGEQIKNQRERLALTQQIVADNLHITRQTLSKWENNKSYPDLKMLLALSDLYHVSVDSLLREDKDLTSYLNRDKAAQAFNIIRGLFWLLIGLYFSNSTNYWSHILIPILLVVIMEYLFFKESFFWKTSGKRTTLFYFGIFMDSSNDHHCNLLYYQQTI